jgi:hypothetical protein
MKILTVFADNVFGPAPYVHCATVILLGGTISVEVILMLFYFMQVLAALH